MKITRRQLKELIKEFVDTATVNDIKDSGLSIQLDSDEMLKEESIQIALQCMPEKYKKYINDDIINVTKSILDISKSSLSNLSEAQKSILCDPQTSGGLLISVSSEALKEFTELMNSNALNLKSIGKIVEQIDGAETIFIK